MTYRVEFTRAAIKQLDALPQNVQNRIQAKLATLATNPRPSGVVKMQGETDIYRIRIGDYRALYTVQDDVLIVLVLKIGHRREVYRG
ncbi:MAG: type II toxin-antitoxin system RelE/ParE family toxin [Lyngbya sp. HA4199-MV5]|jgi:mRNA interferase RelE/StbE|nr:type II toxin-antitoxin system RelE/ParE family toxin [Lyngbya sp. HA4199-MV5]